MKSSTKHFVLITLLLVSALLVGACTGAATPAPSAPAEQAPAAEEPVKEAPAEEAAPESGPSVLRVTFSWPTFIDPAVGNDFSSSASLVNLYDTLIFPNAEGGVDPWLAESWEVSEDGKTYTFKLREGVTFHDGSEVTASDVVYSFDRQTGIGEGFAYMLADAESATAIDDYTVEFKLGEPSGLFLPSLLRLYVANEDLVKANTAAEGPYGENGDYGKDWLLTHDAGSGPYTVKEFPLEEFLLMEKNEDWWGEFAANAPDEIRFIGTTEGVTIRTLMANQELEISDQWQTVQALEALDGIDGVDIAAIPTMSEFYYMINTKIAPTDDVHCRRAMAYAFDYDTAVSLEWPGTQQSQGTCPLKFGWSQS